MKTLFFVLVVWVVSFALIAGVIVFVHFMEALNDSGFFDAISERLTEKLKKKMQSSEMDGVKNGEG